MKRHPRPSENTDICITIYKSSKNYSYKVAIKVILWLVGHQNMRNIKGHSTRKDENHCPNPLGELPEHLPYKKQKVFGGKVVQISP